MDWMYDELLTASSFSIGNTSIDLSDASEWPINIIYVTLDEPVLVPAGKTTSGYRFFAENSVDIIDIDFYSYDPTLLTSFDLPTELPPVQDFDINSSATLRDIVCLACTANAFITDAEVPEPSSLALLWGGFVALLAAQLRNRYRVNRLRRG
jgi:hypothetical protein